MADEARALADLLSSDDAPDALRLFAARSLSYLLRSAELIPHGVEDLGYLDNLFAFRALARLAGEESPELSLRDGSGVLARLSSDAELVAEFLGEDFARLLQAVQAPAATEAGGVPATDLVDDPQARAAALQAVRAWADDFEAPGLDLGENELVKLRAFLRARLPRAAS
jgi:hypothetical protein